MEWEAEYFCTELYPFLNLIVIRPTCDSEWSLLCHSILAFCFTSLFLLCKNMTYFSLCTDYFVWVTCTEIKWTESTVDTFFFFFFSNCYYSISHFFRPSSSAELISLTWSLVCPRAALFSLLTCSGGDMQVVSAAICSQSVVFLRVNTPSF